MKFLFHYQIKLNDIIGKIRPSHIITVAKWLKLELMRSLTKYCWNKHTRQLRFIESKINHSCLLKGLDHCRKNKKKIKKSAASGEVYSACFD